MPERTPPEAPPLCMGAVLEQTVSCCHPPTHPPTCNGVQRSRPENADVELVDLMEESLAALAAAEEDWESRTYEGTGIITYNATLNSLAHLG